ncbi:uncharacterized protein C8R40DRAFT_233063 [Lentinula edodes]|uniref:uncharacterized protein n=1 Tax=Lentinula edodes TaxID=5353 RepID=UPI001E8EAA55|nr:uncharacterized protein C8R40DRAFT_233063 [Lentinula edodes]KAH7874865.1 hypothetical protein C8R40DRAFT_233063 [Lentinula edodes]
MSITCRSVEWKAHATRSLCHRCCIHRIIDRSIRTKLLLGFFFLLCIHPTYNLLVSAFI